MRGGGEMTRSYWLTGAMYRASRRHCDAPPSSGARGRRVRNRHRAVHVATACQEWRRKYGDSQPLQTVTRDRHEWRRKHGYSRPNRREKKQYPKERSRTRVRCGLGAKKNGNRHRAVHVATAMNGGALASASATHALLRALCEISSRTNVKHHKNQYGCFRQG